MAKLRGGLFLALFGLGMPLFAVVFLIPALLSARGAQRAGYWYFRYGMLLARWVCGIRLEIRGTPPDCACVVAAKHQSMLDVFMIFCALPNARFVMKKELLDLPIFNWFAPRAGAVAVDRGGGQSAMKAMVAGMLEGERASQFCIYPQGTRVPPGGYRPYRGGVQALYAATELPCAPVATNAGHFLSGLSARPGVAVIEFLDPIPPGMAREPFMELLENRIETASQALAPTTPEDPPAL